MAGTSYATCAPPARGGLVHGLHPGLRASNKLWLRFGRLPLLPLLLSLLLSLLPLLLHVLRLLLLRLLRLLLSMEHGAVLVQRLQHIHSYG